MTRSFTLPKNRCWMAVAWVLLVGSIILGNPARAAAPPPNVSLSEKTVEGEPVVATTSPSASGARGSSAGTATKGTTPRSGNSTSNTTSQTKVYVEFTIQNQDRSFPTPTLEVNWHLYTKTITMAGNSSKITMADISGSKSLTALAPLAKVVIDSDPIVKNITSSTSTAQHTVTRYVNNGGYNSGSSVATTSSSAITMLDGYYVEVVYNGTVIRKSDTAEKVKYEDFMKTNSTP